MAANPHGPLHQMNIVATHQAAKKQQHKKKTAPASPVFGSPAWRAKYNLNKKP